MIYNQITKSQKYWIKGKLFTLTKLLNCKPVLEIDNYSIIISRLAPAHYHHFYFVCDGVIKNIKYYEGRHLSVQPNSVKYTNVFTENARIVVSINTIFGLIYYVIIGAACVHDISLYFKKGDEIKKGRKFGTFNYGGSTIVILIPNNNITYNKTILEATDLNIETYVPVRYPLI
jgi:phosphatidylserine decarboxylase